jgi:hypothetical protein
MPGWLNRQAAEFRSAPPGLEAGALGRPGWLLLPFAPDYRWLLDREDSSWRPTMRLFRQPRS